MLKILLQGSIEIVGDPALPFQCAEEDGPLLFFQRGDARDWFAGAGDDDLLAGGGAVEQTGEMGFGVVDVDRGHGLVKLVGLV